MLLCNLRDDVNSFCKENALVQIRRKSFNVQTKVVQLKRENKGIEMKGERERKKGREREREKEREREGDR